MRVLVIEDYEPLRKSLTQGIEEAGFAVDASGDGAEGLWYARSHDYDAIVLDLMLPSLDGLSILSKLRREGASAGILILTAKDTLADRVKGLDLGADDYLVKPFALAELLARLRALVRRKYDASDPIIRIDDLEIDTGGRTVSRGGRRIDLSAREYGLLEFLAMRAGRVVSRTDVWEHVYDFHCDPGSNVVDVYVGYLRRKIEGPGQAKLIHTRRGQGYLLGVEG
jgi:DNA-binding response OmpR family regulator